MFSDCLIVLVTYQLSKDIIGITVELGRIYPAFDDEGLTHVSHV